MADSPLSRGKFLRSLGSSVTGMALGTGIGVAAQALATRLASTLPEKLATPSAASAPPAPLDPFINRGSSEGNRIALTFDDGPTPGVTDCILDELRQRSIHATFFMIGEKVAASPELARRVAAEGHEIGNHTFTHPKLSSLPDQQVALEIKQTQEIILEILGYRPICFRPPYLALRKNQASIPQAQGLSIICGDVDSGDWAQPGVEKIVDSIFSRIKPGSILICHDLYEQTANCIGSILDRLIEQDYKFVSVSSLATPSETVP